MKRLAYLRTVNGQRSQYEKRRFARRRFNISQQLRGKNSMKTAEEATFQQAIFDDLQRFDNPPFRADLIAELTFSSSQPNPPQLHTLAKNYLDLLGRSRHPAAGRRHLAFHDDRQIKVLSVSYHLSSRRDAPAIRVELGRLSDLRQDLALIERIRRGDFERDEDEWRNRRSASGPSPLSRDPEDRADEELEEAFDSYRNVMRDTWERRLKADVLAAMREGHQQVLQERFLVWNELIVRRSVLDLLAMPPPGATAALHEAFGSPGRQLLLSEPTSLDLSHAPAISGDTERFRRAVSTSLDAFSNRRPWLFPLRVPLSATLLVVPPRNGIDLDNLARKVVPLVHDRWQPPRTHLVRVDVSRIPDARLQRLIGEQLASEKRFPHTSLTRYEVIELPRRRSDPPSGFVRVALGSGARASTLRRAVDDEIEEWMKTVD